MNVVTGQNKEQQREWYHSKLVDIDPLMEKYVIQFKKKTDRPNQTDDKFELFRHAIGLRDTRDIHELLRYTGHHMTTPIRRGKNSITDINSFYNPIIIAKLTPEQVIRLRKDPNVLSVTANFYDVGLVENTGYQIPNHAAVPAWSRGFKGQGVNVAVMDSGSDPNHVELRTNTKVNQNFTDEDDYFAQDANNHGTHCAGIIGALQGNNVGMAGIAPSCNLWNLKVGVSCPTGSCMSFTDQMEGFEFGKANGAHIVSMSFGGTGDPNQPGDPRDATLLDGYTRVGILYFAASGNDATDNVNHLPAAYSSVNGVSAVDEDSDRASFSNSGTMVDFAGCGVAIESTANGNMYRTLNGTSMACPCVAAVAAVGYSAYKSNNICAPYTPGMRKNQIVEKVMSTICAQGAGGRPGVKNIDYGWGIPQAELLVRALQQN